MTNELKKLLIDNDISDVYFRNIGNVERLFYILKANYGIKEETYVDFIKLHLSNVGGNYRDNLLMAIGTTKGDLGRIILEKGLF